MTNKHIVAAEKYINGVADGSIVVCLYIRQAIERHLNDLKVAPEHGWIFNRKAVQRVFDFFGLLMYSPDKRKVVPFDPEPWQAAITYIVYGWQTAQGFRRFRNVYIEIPKKNGKTTWAATYAAELLIFDGEEEAEVYCAASIEKQSMICFNKAKDMIKKSPALKKHANILKKNVSLARSASKLEPLGRDSNSIEGINTHGSIIDEYHVWKDNDVLENIQSSTVNRKQPLTFIITTAGRNIASPCYETRSLCVEILAGMKRQDDTAIFIYTVDKGDDWNDEQTWRKANPNIDVSVEIDGLRAEYSRAKNSAKQKANFKTKHLNMWVNAPEVWMDDEHITANNHGNKDKDIKGKEAWAGLDLASHVDINALILEVEVDGVMVVKSHFWIPEGKVIDDEDKIDYRDWAERGLLTITPGDVVDIDYLVNGIINILNLYDVKNLAFDPARAFTGVVQGLINAGFEDILMEYKQNIMYMSPPMREIEGDITGHKMDLMNNPIMRWMFNNTVPYYDSLDNIRPDKKKSKNKIDGVVALINARGGRMVKNAEEPGQYAYGGHSLRTL